MAAPTPLSPTGIARLIGALTNEKPPRQCGDQVARSRSLVARAFMALLVLPPDARDKIIDKYLPDRPIDDEARRILAILNEK